VWLEPTFFGTRPPSRSSSPSRVRLLLTRHLVERAQQTRAPHHSSGQGIDGTADLHALPPADTYNGDFKPAGRASAGPTSKRPGEFGPSCISSAGPTAGAAPSRRCSSRARLRNLDGVLGRAWVSERLFSEALREPHDLTNRGGRDLFELDIEGLTPTQSRPNARTGAEAGFARSGGRVSGGRARGTGGRAGGRLEAPAVNPVHEILPGQHRLGLRGGAEPRPLVSTGSRDSPESPTASAQSMVWTRGGCRGTVEQAGRFLDDIQLARRVTVLGPTDPDPRLAPKA